MLFYLAARGAAPPPPTFALDPPNHYVLLCLQFRMHINQNFHVLNHLGDALDVTLASLGATFHDLLAKNVFVRFRCPSAAELLLLKV